MFDEAMHYLQILTVDPDLAPATPEEQREAMDALGVWLDGLDAAGASLLHGSRTRPPEDATTIRIRDGQLIVTDGPYAETKEQVGGYGVVECRSLDTAVRWESRHPHARMGSVEVRPLSGGTRAGRLPEPGPGKARYLLLVCTDPAVDSRVTGNLEPPASARTVRVRQERVIVSDGPFADTKEQIAGFDLLDCADLDEVIEIAARHPMARAGILEVRPLWRHGED